MMQRHHTGSGRRRVIPADWSAHHRPLFEGTRDATVTLRRPGASVVGPRDPATGRHPVTPAAAYYTGTARIQTLPATDHELTAGDQQISTLGYSVYLDAAVDGIQLGDELTVTAMTDNGDSELVDRPLTVEAIERGSLHWQRRLVCTDNLETQETDDAG